VTGRTWLLGIRRALTAILLLVALLALGVLFVLHNEKATSFALSRALSSLSLDLTVERSSGALADGITLYGLRYRSDKVEVAIGTIELEIALGPLLSTNLQLSRLVLADSTIRIIPDAAPAEPGPVTVPRLSAPLPIRIDRLSASNTTIVTDSALKIDRLDGALSWRDTLLTVDAISVAGEGWAVNAAGAVTLDDPVPVDLAFDWAWASRQINGRGQLSGSLAELALEHQLQGAYRLSSNGTVALLNRIVPAADLTHRCPGECGVDGVTLTDLVVHHSGALDASQIDTQVTLSTAQLPSTQIVARAHNVGRSLTIDASSARGKALDLDLTGSVALTPALQFELTTRVRKLRASLISPSANGNIAGKAVVRGSGVDQFRALVSEVSGDLNGYALTGSADVERRGQRVNLKPLRLAIGDNKLVASGTIARDNIELAVDAALPDLSQVDPRFAGQLNANGTVGGTFRAPRARFALDGQTLQLDDIVLDAIDGDLNIDAAGAVGGKLNALGLARGERDLGSAQLSLGGTLEAVDVAAAWQLLDTSLNTQLVLNRTATGLHADVRSAQLDVTPLGTWSTEAPFPIDVEGTTARVGAHTWRNVNAFMQVDNVILGNDIVVNAQLSGMPLQTFTPLLPVAVRLSGVVDASVTLARENGDWRGDVDWRQSDTLLQFARGNTQRRMALPTFALTGELAGQTINVDADIRGDYGLSVYGKLAITGAGVAADPTIDGIFAATLPELNWLGAWVDGVSEVSGNGALNIQATGTVSTPALRGVIAINEAALSLDDAGLRIENLALRGEGREGATIELSGRASSGGGTLDLTGAVVSPWNDRRSLNLNIKGSDVQAFNANDYRVWVSPDLTLQATAKGATLSGSVEIPRAQIRVAEVPPNVVRTSSDIKVDGRIKEQGVALPLKGDITLKLGDQVHIFALGLDADLRGDVGMVIAEGKEPLFNGRLYLDNGKFAAYGQKLTVDRGNLYYAGPINNPVLDFRATRTIREGDSEIRAGVRVSGPALAPAIDVFAEPAMSQTEALSYLILGRSSVNASGADGQTLSQTALSIGLSRSSPLTTQLATGLGLDELTVAGDSLEAAELVAGKQVSDRLYIRYSFGVFSNLGAILLRYRLSSRLELEAGSADAHSLDVLYTIEK